MLKIKPVLKLLLGIVLAICAIASLINLLLIVPRVETISVINAVVGLGVLFFFLAPLAHVLIRNSWRELRNSGANNAANTGDSADSRQS
jgi:hypothetical protein